ncbi:TadE/TadG family type IV pilus assembly protein [Streptomyces sp. NPDC059009]|uniref:TadE/TadG family type IV pilus assembly protein n=1 Tax=Streptomyces sp. NPDC059009 TaxID=3346694 RepID=UPI0036C492BD
MTWMGFTAGRRDDRGQVTVFVVLMSAAVLMFAGLVLDGGLALAAKARAIGEAQEAARAGAQAIDLDAYRADGTIRLAAGQARASALNYLSATEDSGTVRVTPQRITVTVTARQEPQLLKLIGLGSLTVTGEGSARPAHGVSAPEPPES